MAHDSNLPCDGDGLCMMCKQKPPEEETLNCRTCVTPWHLNCLSSSSRPQTLAESAQWECPDCSTLHPPPSSSTTTAVAGSEASSSLIASIRAIESDSSLTDQEKAKKRQELLSGEGHNSAEKAEVNGGRKDVLQLLAGSFNCSFCMQLPERPVTTPCGHNFCLKCFQKWVGQGKRTCAICRTAIPPKMASQPRINSSLVIAIRMAKMTKSNAAAGPAKAYHCVLNQNRPDKAYTTERAKKAGKANACSGKIFVTVPPDHFGPILSENDPERGMGVLVGETWEDRMECRQWGAHLPHVAGICGQSDYGAQSVALSGGYEDDEDHGEWFLYTGSGGRDLSGNKRTNKTQSFDQKFDKSNEALRVSCRKGYPVRVVRSHKEKRSAYAPEKGVRYDGIYRIEKCWRKPGIQGFKVCRYLFVRCDNDPAPWTSDDHGDRPRPLPIIKELKKATDITERKGDTSWDYDEVKGCWLWKVPPPESRRQGDYTKADGTTVKSVKRKTHMMSVSERLLKEFSCLICRKVMVLPLTTPCAHNFCKTCLEGAFAGQTFVRQRTCEGRRTLRAQKNTMKCPSCSNDISEFLQNPQVNRELMSVIESLQSQNNATQDNSDIDEESSGSDVKKEDIHEETNDKYEKSDEEVEDMDVCDPKAEILGEAKNCRKEGKPKPSQQKKPKGIWKKEVDDKGIVPEKRPIHKLAADVSPAKPQISDDELSEAVQDKDGNKGTTKSSPQKRTKRTLKKKADDGGIAPEKKSAQKPAAVNGDGDVSSVSSQIDEKKEADATNAGNEVRRTSKRLKGNNGIQTSTTDAGVKTRNKKLKQEDDDFA